MIRNLIIAGSLSALPAFMPHAVQEPPTQGQAGETEESYAGELPERYAQVRALEGEATVRKGDVDEPLSRGLPLSEGDVVDSHGRGVLQLADGTRIAFGPGTRFTLSSLFQNQKGETQVLLRLERGRLRIRLGAESESSVRIDTPSGRATLGDRGNVGLDVEADRSVRVKVFGGKVRFANSDDRTTLTAGERLTVYSDHEALNRIRDFNTFELDGFESWTDQQLNGRRSQSASRVPSEIRAFADDLDGNGEWVQVEEVGWCWRPQVSVEWRPYWRGRWGAFSGGMTWISDEPWGYVTHHHGRWGWSSAWGWYWIPGGFYAPAWVAWRTVDAYWGWAPLGYWNAPVVWGNSAWHGYHCWNIVDRRQINVVNLHTHIYTESRVISQFGRGAEVGTWDRRTGGRLTPPWQQTPMLVRPTEFRNPGQITTTAITREAQRERLQDYRRQSGDRVIVNRGPLQDRRPNSGTTAPNVTSGRTETGPVPFTRGESRPEGRAPLTRPRDIRVPDGPLRRDPEPSRDSGSRGRDAAPATRPDRAPDSTIPRREGREPMPPRRDEGRDLPPRRDVERRDLPDRTPMPPRRDLDRTPDRGPVQPPRVERTPDRSPDRSPAPSRTESRPSAPPPARTESKPPEKAPEKTTERGPGRR